MVGLGFSYRGRFATTSPHSCASPPGNLDEIDPLFRSPEHTGVCKEAFAPKVLWEKYGIVDGVMASPTSLALFLWTC